MTDRETLTERLRAAISWWDDAEVAVPGALLRESADALDAPPTDWVKTHPDEALAVLVESGVLEGVVWDVDNEGDPVLVFVPEGHRPVLYRRVEGSASG